MSNACAICGNEANNQTLTAREMMFGLRDTFNYLICAQCGCTQLIDVPADLSRYYPENYYSFNAVSSNPLKLLIKKWRNSYAVFGKNLIGKVLHRFSPHASLRPLARLPLSSHARILDVGCGTGHLLLDLRHIGFKHLLGADPFIKSDIHYPSGVSVVKKELAALSGTFDVIMLHHAFEHMSQPLDVLLNIKKRLHPQGTCVIRIPVADSYAFEHYRANWVQLDAPRHLFLHTTKSMEHLCQQAGLQIDAVVHDATSFQFWGSEQYRQGIPLQAENSYLHNKKLFTAAQMQAFAQQTAQLNAQCKGDQAVFFVKIAS